MTSAKHIQRLRRLMQRQSMMEGDSLTAEQLDDVDDATIMSKWIHNTNTEASDKFLERLKKYHPNMDHD